MFRIAVWTAVMALILLGTGCGKDRNCVRGDGFNRTEELVLPANFTRIDLRIAADLKLKVDSSRTFNFLTSNAQANVLEEITTTVRDCTLVIDFDECIKQHSDIRFELSMRDLDRIRVTGVGDITSDSLILADTLEINVDGSGTVDLILDNQYLQTTLNGASDVSLQGVGQRHEFVLNGGSNIFGFAFVTDTTVGRIETSGRARVFPNDYLEGTLNGVGDLLYRGFPDTVAQFGTGSGQIIDDNF